MGEKEKNIYPKVTVFIPTYNYARYLTETIDSVLSQDFEDFELIISDDCSSDNTAEICLRYVEQDSRIRFIRQDKNLGMVENWNWCMEQAKGLFLKPMLADDKFNRPYALSRMVDVMDSDPSLSLVTSARQLIDTNSNPMEVLGFGIKKNRVFAGKSVRSRCLLRDINLIGEPTAVLFRRADSRRGFDTSYKQLVDLEMWLHLLMKGRVFYFSEPLCCFRRHELQQTEVNRHGGVRHHEFWTLYIYLEGWMMRHFLFKCCYRFRKRGLVSEHLEAACCTELSGFKYICHYVVYKLINPVSKFWY